MISVSQEWKDLQQKAIIDKLALIEISMEIYDVSLYTASVSYTSKVSYSKPTDIIRENNYTQARYGTLDKNYWLLDGSRNVLPSLNEQNDTGYISNKEYTPEIITISNLDTYHTIKDIRIIFDDYFTCRDFKYGFYRNNVLIQEVIVNDNIETTYEHNLGESISGYDTLKIEINNSENQRARIKQVVLGILKTFRNKDIISFKMSSSVSPINNSLPQNQINFEIDNMDDTFNPDNPLGYFDTLSKRQKIEVKYGFALDNGDEFINGGTFYLTEWDTPQNSLTATFTAKNIVSFFTKTFYNGVNQTKTLYALAQEIFTYSNWELGDTDIDSSLQSISTKAPMPNVSCAECLQLIAQASNCALYISNDNKVCIKPIDLNTIHLDYVISNFLSYDYPELVIDDEVSYIDIAINNYAKKDTQDKIFDGGVVNGNVNVIFSNCADKDNISIDSSSTATASIVSKSSYLANINITSGGNLIIKGYQIEQSSSVYEIDNETDGDLLEIENDLITDRTNAINVANYIQMFVNYRYSDTVSLRIDPRLELLDIVPFQTKLAENETMIVELDIEFKGYFKGSVKALRLENNYRNKRRN